MNQFFSTFCVPFVKYFIFYLFQIYTLYYRFMNHVRPQRTKEVGVVFKDVYPVLFTHQRFG